MRIAIVGCGISGLGAGWLLDKEHDVVFYEAEHRVGGHARTVTVKHGDKEIDVDTGFIVFNYRNYPNLNGLFKLLDVPVKKSDMSFAAKLDSLNFEYSSKSLTGMFPTFLSLFDKRRWNIALGYKKFGTEAKKYLDNPDDATLEEFLRRLKVNKEFIDYFILPIGAAIWSCPLNTMRDYPAASFLRFFDHHGLLAYDEQPDWYTVDGGSRQYVERLRASLKTQDIRLSTPVRNVKKVGDKVEVTDNQGNLDRFDHVIMGTHADATMRILSEPTEQQADLLRHVRYQANHVILHADTSFMPRNRNCWASWVYNSQKDKDDSDLLSVSYWMNLLQGIDAHYPLIVSLNPLSRPKENLIFDERYFEHPIFDGPAVAAQERLAEVQGQNNIWLAGAWTKYGFHEDGLRSGVEIARALGADVPWV